MKIAADDISLYTVTWYTSFTDMLKMLHTACVISYAQAGMDLSDVIKEDDIVFAAMVTSVVSCFKFFYFFVWN